MVRIKAKAEDLTFSDLWTITDNDNLHIMYHMDSSHACTLLMMLLDTGCPHMSKYTGSPGQGGVVRGDLMSQWRRKMISSGVAKKTGHES